MTIAGRALLVSLALASCASPGRMLTPEPATIEFTEPCPAPARAEPVEPARVPRRVVSLLHIDGTPARAAFAAALDRRGFSPRPRELDPHEHVDFVIFERYTAGPPRTATFVVHDVANDRVVLAIEMLVLDGDLIGPIILPSALATALADHVVAPPPITDGEQAVLAELDEPLCF